jgi:Leucine-rich repeat (LRR) protein
MKHIFAVLMIISSFPLLAQDDDPFQKFGPPGMVYTNLKDALRESEMAFKLRLDNQPIEQKMIPKLSKLNNVQVLQLTVNGLTQLPAEIRNMKNLVYLASIGNEIREFPRPLCELSDLSELHIHSARLDSLPYDIAYLGKLRTLQIQNNKADTFHFPSSIGYLSHLNTMILYNSRLDTLPSSFGEFKRLKSLTISMCGLNKIPDPITKINGLELLVLDKNRIHELPKSLFALRKLKYLSLQQNQLTSIPDNICLLKDLELLDLRGNRFSEYDLAILKALLPRCKILH